MKKKVVCLLLVICSILYAMNLNVIAYENNTLDYALFYPDENKISISGSLGYVMHDKPVTLTVINEVDNNIIWFGQEKIDNNGNYYFSFNISDENFDYSKCIIKANVSGKMLFETKLYNAYFVEVEEPYIDYDNKIVKIQGNVKLEKDDAKKMQITVTGSGQSLTEEVDVDSNGNFCFEVTGLNFNTGNQYNYIISDESNSRTFSGDLSFENEKISIYDFKCQWDEDIDNTIKYSVSYGIANLSDTISFSSFCAAYDENNQLLSINVVNTEIEKNDALKVKSNFIVPDTQTISVVKIFSWNNENEIIPIRSIELYDREKFRYSVELEENKDIITENPYRGWIAYGYLEAGEERYASSVYTRFNWSDIEPKEGQFNWSLIDKYITHCEQQNKRFSFGVVCANTSSTDKSYITPKWVFDLGAKYTIEPEKPGVSVEQFIPVWDDAIFVSKVEKFAKALADRYDGNDIIDFIDIRSYGNYGECHTINLPNSKKISWAKQKKLIDAYADVFLKTKLAISCQQHYSDSYLSKVEYCKLKGIFVRDDAILINNTEAYSLVPLLNYSAAIGEFVHTYSELKNEKYQGRKWNDKLFIDTMEVLKPAYMELGGWNDGAEMINDKKSFFDEYSNKLGYHFVLKNVDFPVSIDRQDNLNISFNFVNSGYTKLFGDCYIKLALIDEENNIVESLWLDNIQLNSLVGGEKSVFDTQFKINSDIQNAKLAIGLFRNKEDNNPAYKIGNYALSDTNWYPFANLIASDDIVKLVPNEYCVGVYSDRVVDDFGYDFETDSDLFVYDHKIAEITTDEKYEGNSSLCINGSSDEAMKFICCANPNKQILLDFYTKTDKDYSVALINSYGRIIETQNVSASNSWKNIKIKFNTLGSEGNNGIYTIKFITPDNITAYIDKLIKTEKELNSIDIDFENENFYWLYEANLTSGISHNGNKCLKVEPNSTTRRSFTTLDLTNFYNVSGPGKYKVSLWIKGANIMSLNFAPCTIHKMTEEQHEQSDCGFKNIIASPIWRNVTVEFDLTAEDLLNNQYITFNVADSDHDEERIFYVDDIKVEKIN